MIALTGGFAQSPYLRQRIRDQVLPAFSTLLTPPHPNEQDIKPACEGAALWFLGRLVRARACRAHYGLNTSTAFDACDPEHARRPRTTWPDGHTYVAGRWASLALKDDVVDEAVEECTSFVRQYAHPNDLLSSGAFFLDLLVRSALRFAIDL